MDSLTISSSSCEWDIINTEDANHELNDCKNLEQNADLIKLPIEERINEKVEDLVDEALNIKTDEDAHSQFSDIDVLDEADVELLSSSFPIDDLNLSQNHNDNDPKGNELIDECVDYFEEEENKERAVAIIERPKPVLCCSRNYIIWAILSMFILGSPHLFEWSCNVHSNVETVQQVQFPLQFDYFENTCEKYESIKADAKQWEERFNELLEENRDLKEVLIESINDPTNAQNIESGENKDSNCTTGKNKSGQIENEKKSEEVIEASKNLPQASAKVIDDESIEILELKNKLNEILTENEEMKQTIGRLRYSEISSLKRLIENHYRVINDLRHENDELKRVIVQLRYKNDMKISPDIPSNNAESKEKKSQNLYQEIELKISDLKEEIDGLKSRFNDQQKISKSETPQNVESEELFAELMIALNEVQATFKETLEDKYSKDKSKLLDSIANLNKKIVYASSNILRRFNLNLESKNDEESNEKNDEEINEDGRTNYFMKFLQDHVNKVGEKFVEVNNLISHKFVDGVINSTIESYEAMKKNVEEKTQYAKESLNEAYSKVSDVMQDTAKHVTKTVENPIRKTVHGFGHTYHNIKKTAGKLWKKFTGTKKSRRNKKKKTKNHHHEGDDMNNNFDWSIKRSKERESLRCKRNKNWFLKRGDDRKFSRNINSESKMMHGDPPENWMLLRGKKRSYERSFESHHQNFNPDTKKKYAYKTKRR